MRASFPCLAIAGCSALSGASVTSAADELAIIAARRIDDLAQFPDPPWVSQIPAWLASQKSDGTWADVNYVSGCAAQRANWPIQAHWNRLITFAAAWSGANPAIPQDWTKSHDLLRAISKGLDFWFSNDYKPADCLGNGGLSAGACPCGTPGLWNTNWYSQAVLIPQLCATTCLLLKGANLTASQQAGCERIPRRAYDLRDGSYGTGGNLTGANVILVMQNSASLALYTNDATMLRDVYSRAMSVITFADKALQDGIHRDGSFLQHAGILYNGNYGKDLLNAFIQLESEAIGTSFAAGSATRDAVATQIRGNEWMIYVDDQSKEEHWDFNVIGRFVAFPTADLQASADINFNVSKLAAAVSDFSGHRNVSDTIRRLQSNGTEKLVGNKGFWASDYMVHRTATFIIGTKMISSRSRNTEAINSANPYGYHLGQGTMFSYVRGDEYKDIMHAWDWNLIPGTTALLNQPRLSKNASENLGKKDFVGVVSDGKVGAAVQDYLDPLDGSLSYRKAWFFQNDSVVVVISDIKKHVADDAPVITVLDNRASQGGNIWVDGKSVPEGSVQGHTLYYGGNGYIAHDAPFNLTLFEGERTGNWSDISTSKAGVTSVSIFSAYTTMDNTTFSYSFFPATSQGRLNLEQQTPSVQPVTGKGVSGAMGSGRLSLVFWPDGHESIKLNLRDIGWASSGSVTIISAQPASYLFSRQEEDAANRIALIITVSDPTQLADSISLLMKFEGTRVAPDSCKTKYAATGNDMQVAFEAELPRGSMAGSSVSWKMNLEF